MNNTTEDLARTCIVCDRPLDMRKASGIPAGTGTDLEYESLAILMHDECAEQLALELDNAQAIAELTASTLAAMEASPEMATLTEKIANQEVNKIKKGN